MHPSRRPIATLSVLSLVAAAANLCQAQIANFTLTDGSVRYIVGNLTGGRTTDVGGSGASLQTSINSTPLDHVYQNWFWYRTAGDTREYALSNQTFGTATSNRALLVYNEPANNGATPNALRVELEYTLTDLSTAGRPHAQLTIGFVIRNLTAGSLSANFIGYADMDLAGGSSNDSASASGALNHTIRIADNAATRTAQAAVSASSTNHLQYQIAPYPDLRDELTDAFVNDLNSTGSPFGPGDMSCAHEWGVLLSPAGADGDSLAGSMTFDIMVQPDVCAQADFDGNGLTQPADVALFVNRWLSALQSGCP